MLFSIFNDLNAYECRACFAYEWDYINTIKDQSQERRVGRKDIDTFIKFFVFCNFIYALEQRIFLAHCNPEIQMLWARREWNRPWARGEKERKKINPNDIRFSERHLKNFIIEKLVEKIPRILWDSGFVGKDKDISIINWSIQLIAQLTTDTLLHDKHYEILEKYLFKH
jgi:hypothetical protein